MGSSSLASQQVRITARDRRLLAFAAQHRLLLGDHVRVLLGISAQSASRRLGALVRAGLLTRHRAFERERPCFQITRTGLAVAGSSLAPPRLDLRSYEHDIGLAWIWLAAQRGTLGPLKDVIAERHLRSHDARRSPAQAPLAVRLGGVGPRGRERLHYPDLLVQTASGHTVAVELELSSKGRTRRERILAGYGAEGRIDAVLYLVERESLGREIATSASKLGLSRLVHVQRVSSHAVHRNDGIARAAERAAVMER